MSQCAINSAATPTVFRPDTIRSAFFWPRAGGSQAALIARERERDKSGTENNVPA